MKKFLLYTILGVAGLAMASCSRDEGPDSEIDFNVPQVAVTHDYPVGVFFRNPGTNGQDATRYERMNQEWDDDNLIPAPHLDLVQGNYGIDQNPNRLTDEMVECLQKDVDWCIGGGVDFWILPALRAKQNTAYPDCLDGDVNLYDIIRGQMGSDVAGTGKRVDLKGKLKFVATVNIEDPLCQSNWSTYDADGNQLSAKTKTLSNTTLLEENDDYVSCILNGDDGSIERLIRRSEVFAEMFKSLKRFFDDPNYYCVAGTRPLVVLQNAHKLYSADCKAFYDKIHAAVKELTGKDIFIVAQQEGCWNPPARTEYFFQGVDAVTNKNMYNQSNWSRSVNYPGMIKLNWAYNRDYFMSHWNIDFIPTGAPAFNGYVDNGNTDKPIVKHDVKTFSAMCNVMRYAAGRCNIMFIDSYNNLQYCSFLAPTKQGWAWPEGFGTEMLDVVKKEFKK